MRVHDLPGWRGGGGVLFCGECGAPVKVYGVGMLPCMTGKATSACSNPAGPNGLVASKWSWACGLALLRQLFRDCTAVQASLVFSLYWHTRTWYILHS
jgi:hypothetical protein